MKKYDNVIPKEKWEFDSDVAECFDNMLERSIPDYHRMRDLTQLLIKKHCKNFLTEESIYYLLDLGCSNGINLEPFVNDVNFQCVGIDISEPMLKKAQEKFVNKKNVKIFNHDLKDGLNNFLRYEFITSILTLQFIPMEYRQDILTDIYNHLSPKGMFVFVEKTLGSNSIVNNLFTDSYYSIKNKNGYDYDAIDRKKKSLEGVLVPCTSNWNRDLLKQAGFKKIETFWKCLNFEGIVAIKEG